MIASAFEYHKLDMVDGVVSLLSEWDDDARIITGGHSLIVVMKQRMTDISHLSDLGSIAELKSISIDGDTITIGAGRRQRNGTM